jgi:hypothetical protein
VNQRERILAIVIAATVLLGGAGWLFNEGFLKPLDQRADNQRKLEQDIEDRRKQLHQILADRPRLERYRRLSLPADLEMDRVEYEKFLVSLMSQSGFDSASSTVTPKPLDTQRTGNALPGARKAPAPFTRLGFAVQAHAKLGDLVKFLDSFYRAGFLHQVRKLSIQRTTGAFGPQQQRPDDLDISFDVEALVVNGAEKRGFLLPTIDGKTLAAETALGLAHAPTGLALTAWAAGPTGPMGPGVLARSTTSYADMSAKNIFTGAAESGPEGDVVEVTHFVYLTDITYSKGRYEAFLYDRYNNHTTRLRSSAGFDRFRISDNNGKQMIQGKVVHLDSRFLIYQANGKYYTLHVGQNIGESLKKPMSRDEVDSLTKRPG